MANKKEEPSLVQQGEAEAPPPPPRPEPPPPDQQRSRRGNNVFKTGPLFISSKGIGWTSWKKRWFILTQTSLVFFRSDPTAAPQKGGEVNLTLGGIDLNNSGSVVVKADKKLLTVLLGDGRDGRAFTLKAETSEDLYEWKTALENALAQAPSPVHVMGQNGIFRNDQADVTDGSKEQSKDKPPTRYTVTGTPILLALKNVDGAPTFLEKALQFVEEYGIKVEGILRQAADVEDVERRIREYEQGKTEFSPEEDAHVIADCVKYVLRELPSYPVPASCCKALLQACRTDRSKRVNAMRGAIYETFPEPNRHLLQRILIMMQTVASHTAENRMSSSAVAACMAPLLLRPLLHGDCEIENDFDVGDDGSMQLLQAAAAANHAQSIVITLLEEYKTIFGEGPVTPDLYSDSEESCSGSEEATDDESYVDDEDYEDDASQGSEEYTDDDLENTSNRTGSEDDESVDNDLDDEKESPDSGYSSWDSEFPDGDEPKPSQKLPSSSSPISLPKGNHAQRSEKGMTQSNNYSATQTESAGQSKDVAAETAFENETTSHITISSIQKSTTAGNGPNHRRKHPTIWGRTSAKKNLSMESIDFSVEEEEDEIEKLKATKADLQNRIADEVKGNAILQASLEKRKKTLHDHHLALKKDVAKLQEQLQKERDKRKAFEAGLDTSQRPLSIPATIDEKTKTELEEIVQAEAVINILNQKVHDLSMQLNQHEQNFISMHDSSDQSQQIPNHQPKLKVKQKDTETGGSSLFGRSKSKETWKKQVGYMDGARNQNEKKQEVPNKQPSQTQQLDSAHSSNSMSARAAASSAVEIPSKPSKKFGSKGEGANSSSTLTKLSNRLNFLKERRNQIANELQNMHSSQGRSEKGRGSETHQSAQNPEKRGTETSQSSHNPDKGAGLEGQTLSNSEKSRKVESHNPDGGRRLEDHPLVLDRVRSEAHVTQNADKPPGGGSQSQSQPQPQPPPSSRTNSK